MSDFLVFLGWVISDNYPRGVGKGIDQRFRVNTACLLDKNDVIGETAPES